jgi:drug/metabolite transporter (DMT)-like permease
MNKKDYFLYMLVLFGWSTSWLPLKGQVGSIAPEVSILWRFIIAGAICFLISKAQKLPLKFTLSVHIKMALMGFCMFSTNFTLFYYASENIASGLLAVVWSMASMINILLVAILTKSKPHPKQLLASLIGLSGIALIFAPELMVSNLAMRSLVLCIIGTIFFCSGNIISGSLQKENIPVMSANSWGMFYGCGVLIIYTFFLNHAFDISFETNYLLGLLWLAIISTVLTFSCYLVLLGRIGAGRVGYATVIFPIFALLISTVFENYNWTLSAFLGVILVVIGNLIMSKAA